MLSETLSRRNLVNGGLFFYKRLILRRCINDLLRICKLRSLLVNRLGRFLIVIGRLLLTRLLVDWLLKAWLLVDWLMIAWLLVAWLLDTRIARLLILLLLILH